MRQASVASLGLPLFAAAGAGLGPAVVAGWGGRSNVHVMVRHQRGERGPGVEVDTSIQGIGFADYQLIHGLLGNDVERPLRFPVTSTVTREVARIRVGGRRREVPVYRCGLAWTTILRSAHRWVRVRVVEAGIDPADFEIIRLDENGVRAALAETEKIPGAS